MLKYFPFPKTQLLARMIGKEKNSIFLEYDSGV
jgi:hypothetical protein